MKNIKAEILSPAGDLERLKAAVDYGADAVYLAGKEFGMRASPLNFNDDDLIKAIKYSHDRNAKVYLTCNTLPRNDEIKRLPAFIEKVKDFGVDAFIVADIGVFNLVKKYAKDVDIHISTQMGIVNYETARAFYEMGAKRVVLARELPFEDIFEIREKTDKNLEIEAFVHGSMCVSFSGRCLLSNYLTKRDANRGDCAQPCRWKYNLVEENREGKYFPIEEDSKGTYILNSRDLCMIDHIDKILKSGITSLKIEGRAKSSYYVAVTTNAYKMALLDYYKMGKNWKLNPLLKEELEKISHREYNTGFYFKDEPGQVYENGGYIRKYDVVAVCDGYNEENKMIEISQKNKFLKGDVLDILQPGEMPFNLEVKEIFDEWGNKVDQAPHAMQKLFIPCSKAIKVGSFFRRKR